MKSLHVLICLVSLTGASRAADSAGGAGSPESQRDAAGAEVSLSLLGAFGAGGRFEDNAVNRYGAGMGARAGVTLAEPELYLGGSFLRFLGGEDQSGEFYTSTFDLELGYDLRLLGGLLVVRPELALGVAQVVTIQSDNAGYPLGFHAAPGLLAGVRLTPLWASVEVRRDLVPGDWSSATSVVLGAGALF